MSDLTKLALEEALKQMLLKKPIDRITISDLTDLCDVSRMTFYYHFKDIYDLVEWSCEHDAARALGENKTYETWQEGFLLIFQEVKKNRPFVENVYHSVGMRQIMRYLNKMTYQLLIDVVEETADKLQQEENIIPDEEEKEFIANFYKHAFVGLMLDWIDGNMQDDPKKLIERLEYLIGGTIRQGLINACNHAKNFTD